jgi:hypothetical protein
LFTYNNYGNGGFSQRINSEIEVFYKLREHNFYGFHFIYKNKYSNNNLKSRINEHKKKYLKNNYKALYIKPIVNKKFFFLIQNVYYKLFLPHLIKYIKKNKIDLIYAENLTAGYLGYLVKKKLGIDYILDYHGVVPEESKFFGSYGFINKINYRILKNFEKKTIKEAKSIVVVSNYFKKYINKNFNYNINRIEVIPSAIDKGKMKFDKNIRNKYRSKLNVQGKKVFIYNGSYTQYQCIDEMIRFFAYVNKIHKETFFIFLTTDNLNVVKNKFKKHGIDSNSYYVNSVEHEEVINYQMASDYGIIFREDNIVNKVASPTKVYEYLSTGLKIIGTNNIGDIEQIPSDKYLFNYHSLFKELKSNLEDILSLKKREDNFRICKRFLEDNYLWENYTEVFNKIFK